MKHFLSIFGVIGACLLGNSAVAVSAGTVGADGSSRGVSLVTNTTAGTNLRGNAGLAQAYKANQRNTYYMVTQLDVDTACRQKLFQCFAEYCGDTAVVPGVSAPKCTYASPNELYNYALLCLQRDTDILLPQYNTNTHVATGGMNTAARLCPQYIQQEMTSYLSMMNMADQLAKSSSDLCISRRRELEAAMACHTIALSYGTQTDSMLKTLLTDACGAGVPGGSAEMVTRFANAGNVGANIWGWADKIVSLDLNSKGDDWQAAVDAVLASYTNRMNLACGDNQQMNTVSHPTGNNGSTALQTVAALALGSAYPTNTQQQVENPYANQSIAMEVTSRSELYNYDMAYQVVNAAMVQESTTPNAFLNSAQIDDMQQAYIRGTKVFVIRDSARCYMIPVAELTLAERTLVAQGFANCVSK